MSKLTYDGDKFCLPLLLAAGADARAAAATLRNGVFIACVFYVKVLIKPSASPPPRAWSNDWLAGRKEGSQSNEQA